jgi:hypothetical protein
MRESRPFGVVCLKSGSEARSGSGETVSLHDVGTLAELLDVDAAQAGILIVRFRGTQRFELGDTHQQADGLWLGALSGSIIGHNRGGNWRHNGWRGAAWGAGAGWLLGSIYDANYGYDGYGGYGYDYGYSRVVTVPAPQPVVVQAAPQPAAPAPQQITIINNYYGNASPMASANSLFGR